MSTDATPLSDILDNDTPATEPAARDDQGRFASVAADTETGQETGVTPQEEPPAAISEPPSQSVAPPEPATIPYAALRDERNKRQALEAELARFRASQQPAPPMQTQAEQPADAPDMFEDPAGFQAWVRQAAAADAMQLARQEFALERTRASAIAAQSKYADYDATIEAFKGLAAANPGLEQTMMQQPDPAEWAYRTAKTHLEVAQYGSVDALVEARIKAREAELVAAATAQVRPSLPPTITTDRNVGNRTQGPAWNGPKPLSAILT
jgi:hypothetical protein